MQCEITASLYLAVLRMRRNTGVNDLKLMASESWPTCMCQDLKPVQLRIPAKGMATHHHLLSLLVSWPVEDNGHSRQIRRGLQGTRKSGEAYADASISRG